MFDNIPHELLLKAVDSHFPEKWVRTYIERWLKAPVVMTNGEPRERQRGTPQGGVLSPLLSNLFMHYANDLWMQRQIPDLPWCRYCDDGLVHCKSKKQAEYVEDILGKRMASLGLELHPEKTRIIHCVDARRQEIPGDHETSFVFLGYEF